MHEVISGGRRCPDWLRGPERVCSGVLGPHSGQFGERETIFSRVSRVLIIWQLISISSAW